eukprot:CAMPEP_0202018672 /NCGR_PEP_ID=MMETSP0905-20130828/40056_1 /ASSEMBLY_ACC=CAM_ASM_000554 /TAXON_ID=420261 /ORGANISM="Thalassiosira antarctica, Strain CCMP982" /LENGTH=642 /DNA_ID=CAMNT_0048579685 /DNA_START=81 /DNA_END=2007 /DNA_ORIENTATION=+
MVRETIDSDAFRSERVASGWAEVTTRLVPREELYDRDEYRDDDDDDDEAREKEREERLQNDYSDLGRCDETFGYHDIENEVIVDGVIGGTVLLVLFPRRSLDSFDAHSRELQEVGWTLCDSSGRPKVHSIKEADADGSAKRGGFLHVVSVRVRECYRPSDNTDVVAKAVRAAVSAPELNSRWTLATAISDANVYITREEKRKMDKMDSHRWDASGTDDDNSVASDDKKGLDIRWKECAKLDTRTFLRVGYRQIPEVVGAEKDKPCWLFALPDFLDNPTVLSHEEALAIPLHESPELPPKPVGTDADLLDIIMKASNTRRRELHAWVVRDRELRVAYQAIDESEANLARTIDERQRNQEEIQTNQESLAQSRQLLEENRSHLPEEMMAAMDANVNQIEQLVEEAIRQQMNMSDIGEAQSKLRGYRTTLDESSAKMRELDADRRGEWQGETQQLQSNVAALVNEKGASIRKSFVLHCSSRLLLDFTEFLLEMVPPSERIDAINDLDMNGSTPLHCAVLGLPELEQAAEQYNFVQRLFELGADKNIMDPATGKTALGQYRCAVSSSEDYSSVFGHARGDIEEREQAWRLVHERMEEALMPARGESEADRDAKRTADGQHSSDDEEDIDEEEDMDEEENMDVEEDD